MQPPYSKHLYLIKENQGYYKVFSRCSDTHFADLLMKEDGFYDYWPTLGKKGCFPAYILRAMADALDDLNRDWESQIENDLSLK